MVDDWQVDYHASPSIADDQVDDRGGRRVHIVLAAIQRADGGRRPISRSVHAGLHQLRVLCVPLAVHVARRLQSLDLHLDER